MKKLRFILLVFILQFSLEIKSQEIDSTFFTKEFINQFIELTINDRSGKESRVIKKWTTDVAIYIEEDSLPDLKLKFITFIEKIEPYLNGIKISIVDDKALSNYILNFSKDLYANKYWNWWDSGFNIYKGALWLNPEIIFNSKEQFIFLKELFIYSLGNMSFSENVPSNSIFYNKYSISKDLTSKDLKYVSFLYSNFIKQGMTKKEIKKLIRK